MKKINIVLASIVLMLMSTLTVFASDTNNLIQRVDLAANQSVTVPLSFSNADSSSHSYRLDAAGVNNQYEVYFDVNSKIIKTIQVDANSKIDFNAHITLIDPVVLNQDGFQINLVREDNQVIPYFISINISQNYVVSANTSISSINVVAGKSFDIPFTVTNNGSSALTNLSIESSLPSKWATTETTSPLSSLAAGESASINLHIDIPSAEVSGQKNLSFKVNSTETSSMDMTVIAQVSANSNITIYLLGALALVAGFVILQFKKFGRR